MTSESLRSISPQRSPSPVPPPLQLPSGKEVSDILQQVCSEISQSTTAEIVEIANSADSRRKLADLMPVYFYSWQLQSAEAVSTHLLLHYFILWRDCCKLRRDRQVFEYNIKRLKGRVEELEIRGPNPEISRLTKQVQDLKTKNEKLQSAHDELHYINSQWALDYKSLTQEMSANSTGCYSSPSSTSSHRHFSICTQCPQLERQLEESNSEVSQLTAKLEKLQRTIDQRNGEVEQLENENRAIQFQLHHTPDDDAQPKLSISATPPHPQPVENCCTTSVFVQGSLVYDSLSASACPVHQDVSPHTYNLHCVVTGL